MWAPSSPRKPVHRQPVGNTRQAGPLTSETDRHRSSIEEPGQSIYPSGECQHESKRIQDQETQQRRPEMVSLLQKDGRMPIVTIAKELGVSETTARSRLKRLLADDVIKVVAVSNPIRLGFEIIGNIKLSIDLKKKDAILQALKNIDALNYVALTTGGNDIDIEFIAGSLSEFKTLVFERISQIDGVNSVETSLIVEIIKDTWDYGTAWDD
jgi:Lrp/AsnC family transcriptional regulator for asnA, asnC and gidA